MHVPFFCLFFPYLGKVILEYKWMCGWYTSGWSEALPIRALEKKGKDISWLRCFGLWSWRKQNSGWRVELRTGDSICPNMRVSLTEWSDGSSSNQHIESVLTPLAGCLSQLRTPELMPTKCVSLSRVCMPSESKRKPIVSTPLLHFTMNSVQIGYWFHFTQC